MTDIKYSGKLFQIIEKPVGEKKFEVARRAPGTRLIIQLPNEKILLTREFRHELNEYDYRLPGGKVFDTLESYTSFLESGSDIQQAALVGAKKEAKEEAGINSGDFTLVGKSTLGATVEWDLYYYLVTSPVLANQETEEGEDVSLIELDKETAKEYCLNGQISEERSALRLFQFLSKHL